MSARKDQWGNVISSNKHGFSRVMCNDYLCNMILDYMDHSPTLWSLLNVNRCVRASLLTYHFHRYRRVIIMRLFIPSHWPMPHPTHWTLDDERYKRRMIDSGRWPKNKKYFDRFTDFNFEEFVIGKLLRIPYWFAPTIDTAYSGKMAQLGLNLTTLTLDGTAVTGRGLFGYVAMPVSNDVYRTSPGLISYVAHHLEHLSIKNCPNVQHSDIAIYLLLPPSDNCQLSSLVTLRCFNSGEAPTHGPFHNLPGFGSKNLITQKSDNILNIQILGLLFTRIIPTHHHKAISLPLTIPAHDPQGISKHNAYARFDDLIQAGWFDPKILTRFPPPVSLEHPDTQSPVPGPFGGFISLMNESLALKSVSRFRNIKLDWSLCCLGSACASFSHNSFTPVARINNRTGRTVQLGNLYGAVVGGKIRRQDYFHVVDGLKPRIPVALSTFITGKSGTYLPARQDFSHAPNDPPDDDHPDNFRKFRPKFLSLAGSVPGPDYEDPAGEGDKTTTVTGLSGAGLHTHSCAGKASRRERGGKECVNCGLWEYEDYVWTYEVEEEDDEDEEMGDEPNEEEKPKKINLIKVKNPGRRIIGELCEICVPFFTCGDCGDFYCPSCLLPPRPNERPNPWATSPPHPNLMRHPCRIHGGTCEICFFAYRYECQKCQRYVCIDCIDENLEDPDWKRCSVCSQFVCKECGVEKEDEAAEIMICKEEGGAFEVGHEFCLNCLGGICRYCEEAWCSSCFRIKRDQFAQDHGVVVAKDNYSCFTCQTCFETQLAFAQNDLQRNEVWKFVGVNMFGREMRKVKQQELEYAKDAILQKAQLKQGGNGESLSRFQNLSSSGVGRNFNMNISDDSDASSSSYSSSSSGYSSSSTLPENSGKNHLIIKAMDTLYTLLGTLLSSRKSIPHGTADLMKAIRISRKYILARKLAEQSYRYRRECSAHPRKRLKNENDPALKDPRLSDSQNLHLKKIMKHVIPAGEHTNAPLSNIVKEFLERKVQPGYEWVPTEEDIKAFESETNDLKSGYFMTERDLMSHEFLPFNRDKFKTEKERETEDWRLNYRPRDWKDEESKGLKREAEPDSSDEENVVMAKRKEGKKDMKKSLKGLRIALNKMKLEEGRGSDGKPLRDSIAYPEEEKRKLKELGKKWTAKKETQKREYIGTKLEADMNGPPEVSVKALKKRSARNKRKKPKVNGGVSVEEELVGRMTSLMQDVRSFISTDIETRPRIRGNAVRFGEASGQNPPGATRPVPAVLDGRQREVYHH